MDTNKSWIVVVDDDPIALKNTRDLLSGEELKISSLRSGSDLLIFIKKNRPDLILLDIMMPEMDGFETYRRLLEYEKEEGRTPTPVIFLTGENDSEAETKGLMIGASDFIRKPISKDVLLKRVQNIISNKAVIKNLTEETVTDSLTGLYNKAYEKQEMPGICLKKTGMLVMIDLDSFKLVNDIYGHDMGDRVLIAFADILKRNSTAGDILCRIGGDEFLAFFPGLTDEDVAISFHKNINEQIMKDCIRLMGDDFDIPIGVSAGCIQVSENRDYNELFQFADKALYSVKQNGKHGIHFFETEDQTVSDEFDPAGESVRMSTLCGERGRAEGAMMLCQDEFIPVYRYMERSAAQRNAKMKKILAYLTSDDGTEKGAYIDAMTALGDILQDTLKKDDAVNKCRYNCFFIALAVSEGGDEKTLMSRIEQKWEETGYKEKFRLGFE